MMKAKDVMEAASVIGRLEVLYRARGVRKMKPEVMSGSVFWDDSVDVADMQKKASVALDQFADQYIEREIAGLEEQLDALGVSAGGIADL